MDAAGDTIEITRKNKLLLTVLYATDLQNTLSWHLLFWPQTFGMETYISKKKKEAE